MSAVILALAIYGLACTLLLVYQQKRTPSLPEAGAQLLQVIPTFTNPADKANALVELAKLEHELRPWWERALSTIGIVAFASMSVATTVQTLNATFAQHQLERTQERLDQLADEIEASEELLVALSHGALERYSQFGERDASATKLLSYRLDQLVGTLSPTPDDLKEAYAIAFVLEQYETAFAVLSRNPELLDNAIPADIVTLAEFYFLSRAEEQARELVDSARAQITKLSKAAKLRLLVLDSALGRNQDSNRLAIQALLKISADEANLVLNRGAAKLRDASNQIRISSG